MDSVPHVVPTAARLWPQRLAYAKSWLETCKAAHNRCRARSASYVPTRILDLRQAILQPDLVLFETHSQPIGCYACLSYCWGPSQPLKTTKANLEDMTNRISWSSLPRSFQDAVFVARQLNIDYLWIDSLFVSPTNPLKRVQLRYMLAIALTLIQMSRCIIQDDLDDWAAEASAMADIFGNAYVTICASVAENCDAVFLREPICPESREIHGHTHNGAKISVHVRPSLSHAAFDDFGNDRYDPGQNPLGQRAWAFQEYILSPRLLQFGPSEIH